MGQEYAGAIRDEQTRQLRGDAPRGTDDEHALLAGGIFLHQSQSPTVCSSFASAAISRSFSMARV